MTGLLEKTIGLCQKGSIGAEMSINGCGSIRENHMRLEQNVVHRKVITSWYDTDLMCAATLFFSVLVFLFCLAGISVCEEQRAFLDYIWVPASLLTLSAVLFVSVGIRLVQRVIIRYQNKYLKNFTHAGP